MNQTLLAVVLMFHCVREHRGNLTVWICYDHSVYGEVCGTMAKDPDGRWRVEPRDGIFYKTSSRAGAQWVEHNRCKKGNR